MEFSSLVELNVSFTYICFLCATGLGWSGARTHWGFTCHQLTLME